jgi:hypothetical protein
VPSLLHHCPLIDGEENLGFSKFDLRARSGDGLLDRVVSDLRVLGLDVNGELPPKRLLARLKTLALVHRCGRNL